MVGSFKEMSKTTHFNAESKMRHYIQTFIWKKAAHINLINILTNTYKNLINKPL